MSLKMCDPCPGYGQCVIVDGKKCCGYVYNDKAFCKKEDGKDCDIDYECLNENCNHIGKCGVMKKGEACGRDSDCENQHCGRTGKNDQTTCCQGDMRTHWDGGVQFKDWCIEGPGSACVDDMQCTSDKCVKGTCSSRLEPKDACSRNSECENRKCGRYGKTGDLKCCPGDMRTSIWNFDYCIAEKGEECFYNNQCRSEMCSNNNICE